MTDKYEGFSDQAKVIFMRHDMQRIWDICHIPTSDTPHRKAYTHFAADFTQIREICKQWMPVTSGNGAT